jgi:alpha-N-arabinofuranosidase
MKHKYLTLSLLFCAMMLHSSPASSQPVPNVSASLQFADPGPAINPFIYGQFVEHLGRCVYGGIWAEMLEDR